MLQVIVSRNDIKEEDKDRERVEISIQKALEELQHTSPLENTLKKGDVEKNDTTKNDISEEVEEIEEELDDDENVVSIKYGGDQSIYQLGGIPISEIADEIYGHGISHKIDYDTLFSYMGKNKMIETAQNHWASINDTDSYFTNSDKKDFGELQGMDARSVVDRLFLVGLFGDTTTISSEEKDKYKYWKWFNTAERRLYEAMSPFKQTPYWQLAPMKT